MFKRFCMLLIGVLALAIAGCQMFQPHFTNRDRDMPASHDSSPGSYEWQRQVDAVVKTVDPQAHGPDIGSYEWCNTIEFKLYQHQSGLTPCSPEWNEKVQQELFPQP